jgi:hypothetical protein
MFKKEKGSTFAIPAFKEKLTYFSSLRFVKLD